MGAERVIEEAKKLRALCGLLCNLQGEGISYVIHERCSGIGTSM